MADGHPCRDVRVGRLRCSADGHAQCEPLEQEWRETEDGCDEDQDGLVDEKKGCPGSRERGELLNSQQTPMLGIDIEYSDQNVSYSQGGEQGIIPETYCSPSKHQWSGLDVREVPVDHTLNWTWMSDCTVPGQDQNPQDYQGRWIRWRLPELSQPDRFTLVITLRKPNHLIVCAHDIFPPKEITVRIQNIDGSNVKIEPIEINSIHGGTISAKWPCVELSKGITEVYIYDYIHGACSCQEEECKAGPVFIPANISLQR